MLEQQHEYIMRGVEERGVRLVRMWFTDILGQLKSFAISPAELENALDGGMTFDGSSNDGFSRTHEADVLAILSELGVPEDRPIIEVLNKTDLLEPDVRRGLEAQGARGRAYAVSALTGAGMPAFLAGLEAAVTRGNIEASLKLDAADGEALAFAYRHAQVLERRDRAGKISLSLRISPQDRARFENRFSRKIVFKKNVTAES